MDDLECFATLPPSNTLRRGGEPVRPGGRRADLPVGCGMGIFESLGGAECHRGTRVGWLAGRTSRAAASPASNCWRTGRPGCSRSTTPSATSPRRTSGRNYSPGPSYASSRSSKTPRVAAAMMIRSARRWPNWTPGYGVRDAGAADPVPAPVTATSWPSAGRRPTAAGTARRTGGVRAHAPARWRGPDVPGPHRRGGRIPPRPEEFSDPSVVSLAERATNIACWANDILSYPKEVARSRIVQSLPPWCRPVRLGYAGGAALRGRPARQGSGPLCGM